VFFNFDFSSSVFRKNPHGAIRAFSEAFRDRNDAVLVFKTTRADSFPEKRNELTELARSLDIGDRFFLLDGFLPQRDVYALTNACDAYLSLHRGEGFGLGVAEAMSLGKPVVVSDCSSTTEFCVEGAALRVPCSVRAVDPSKIAHPSYSGVRSCFEPDAVEASRLLRRLYDDSVARQEIGLAARREIAERFSPDRFRESVEAFLSNRT
jgi:glycosyltransferase involved in cell wall biosynthesis